MTNSESRAQEYAVGGLKNNINLKLNQIKNGTRQNFNAVWNGRLGKIF